MKPSAANRARPKSGRKVPTTAHQAAAKPSGPTPATATSTQEATPSIAARLDLRRNWAGVLGVVLFLGFQLTLLVQGFIPGDEFPWRMFGKYGPSESQLEVWGETADGKRLRIDLLELFPAADGSPDMAPWSLLLKKKNRTRTDLQVRLVEWVDRRMKERNVALVAVGLESVARHIRTQKVTRQPLASFSLAAGQRPMKRPDPPAQQRDEPARPSLADAPRTEAPEGEGDAQP